MATRLERTRSLLERHWPWFVFATGSAFFLGLVALTVDQGLLADFEAFPAIVRGYTLIGVVLGVASVGFCFLSFFYSLRKRSLQEKMPLFRGTMTAWLWAHVYFGVLAIVAGLGHAGYGLLSLEFSTGKSLFLLLLLLVVSGALWRIFYGTVPKSAARTVGNYSEQASRSRAEALLIEIEKLAAGRSPRFHEFKRWLLDASPSDIELARALQQLAAEEQPALSELAGLAAERQKLISREKKQASYRRLLQGWRILHVPLSLAFLALIPLHVLMAFDAPARTVALGAVDGSHFGGFESAESCRSCHASIVDEWRTSMHAHAMTSPVMIAQTNQVLRKSLNLATSPDPAQICVNCHGPIGAALTDQASLPLASNLETSADESFLNEGVSCAACHQWQGESKTGGAGLSAFKAGYRPGREYFGPIAAPVGNAFHKSSASPLFKEPEQLCRNCHAVAYDRDGDGTVKKGTDLVLQTLFDEWQDYARAGGVSCTGCHMPASAETRAAASALIPFEQDRDAPARRLRSHRFVGVDYPIDIPSVRDQTRAEREALLRRAATLTLLPGSISVRDGAVSLSVQVTNSGVGHNMPGGFAFVRQMWLELTILDRFGVELSSSGKIADSSQDLCDASIVDDPNNPMRPFLSGCQGSDPLLVNFQQMLLDRTEVARDRTGAVLLDARGEPRLLPLPDGREAVLQHLTGGSMSRTRPHTGQPTTSLSPGASATFAYRFPPSSREPVRVSVRLLFRTMPPYFLKALAAEQRTGDGPNLGPLVTNLEVIEMAAATAELAGF